MKALALLALAALIACPTARAQNLNIVFNIPDEEREVVFFDDFDDDRNGWDLESDIAKLKIDKGVFTIDRSKADNSYIHLKDGFDFFDEDFTIEVKMRKTKGKKSEVWFGLAWAYESDADYSNMLLGADGTYSLAFVRLQGEYTKAVDWNEHVALEEGDKWNTFRIERRAPSYTIMGQRMRMLHDYKYHFYINDTLARSYDDWPAFYGDQIGFRLSSETKVEIDYIKITRP